MKPVFKQFSVWYWTIVPICLACIQLSTTPEPGSVNLRFRSPYELQEELGTFLTDVSKKRFVATLWIGYHFEIPLSNEYCGKGRAVWMTRLPVASDTGSIRIEFTAAAAFKLEMQRNWVPKIRYRGMLKFWSANQK